MLCQCAIEEIESRQLTYFPCRLWETLQRVNVFQPLLHQCHQNSRLVTFWTNRTAAFLDAIAFGESQGSVTRTNDTQLAVPARKHATAPSVRRKKERLGWLTKTLRINQPRTWASTLKKTMTKRDVNSAPPCCITNRTHPGRMLDIPSTFSTGKSNASPFWVSYDQWWTATILLLHFVWAVRGHERGKQEQGLGVMREL